MGQFGIQGWGRGYPLLLGPRAPSPAPVRNTNSFLPDAFCAAGGRGRPRSHKKLTISTQADPLPGFRRDLELNILTALSLFYDRTGKTEFRIS